MRAVELNAAHELNAVEFRAAGEHLEAKAS
jgi:hypothetical protein